MIVTVGIPLDENSSYLRGAAAAPENIRRAFHSDSANYWTEQSLNLQRHPQLIDDGDLNLRGMPGAFEVITAAVKQRVQQGHKVLSLGAITPSPFRLFVVLHRITPI